MKNIHFGIVLLGCFLGCTVVAVALPQLNLNLNLGGNNIDLLQPLTSVTDILGNMDVTLRENYKRIAAVVSAFLNGSLTTEQVLYFFFNGVYIAPNNSSDSSNGVGGASLVLTTACESTISPFVTCYLCNEDCYTAHNLWGGTCAPSTLNGQTTCLCAESAAEAAQKGLTPNSTLTCANRSPIAGESSLLSALGLRIRTLTALCQRKLDGTYDSIGCDVDCIKNHGFVSGSCQSQIPNVPQPTGMYLYGNNKPNTFCVCSHNNMPNTTFTVQPTSG